MIFPNLFYILSDDSREDNRGRGIEGDDDDAGGDDRVVEMKGKVEAVIENEEGEDGVVEMKGEVEVVVENVWVMSEGDVDEIQKRDNTDKAERIIQEIVTHLLE